MNLSDRDRRALIIGSVLLAALLVVRFAVLPWLDDWRQVRDRIDSTTETLHSLDRKVKRRDHLHEQLARTYGPAASKPLTDVQTTQVAFHKTVQDVLGAAGIKFESIKSQPVKPIRKLPGISLVPVQISGKCQIAQLAKFLAQAQRADMVMIVDRMNVSVNAKKRTELSVTMVLATLAQKEQSS